MSLGCSPIIHSRGTKIGPILLPLTQALDPMSKAELAGKLGSRALIFQALCLVPAIFSIALKLGPIGAWLLTVSLLGALTAFASGAVACALSRSVRWLGLLAAASLVAFFSILISVTLDGGSSI